MTAPSYSSTDATTSSSTVRPQVRSDGLSGYNTDLNSESRPFFRPNRSFLAQPSSTWTTSICTCGTSEASETWFNYKDVAGIAMSALSWILILFAYYVSIWIVLDGSSTYSVRSSMSESERVPDVVNGLIITFLTFMTLLCHLKVAITDPGAVPKSAMSIVLPSKDSPQSICGKCDSYKPPRSHHCRICGRCIVRMDHHCPWMNNCIGANNQKHFILFLIYTWLLSAYTLSLSVVQYLKCKNISDGGCAYTSSDYDLMSVLLVESTIFLLFTSSMLFNQIFGILTGFGTVDRIKRRRRNGLGGELTNVSPVPLKDIFGVNTFSWWLPTDVEYDDIERVFGYRLPDFDELEEDDLEEGDSYY